MDIQKLKIKGDVFSDDLTRKIYATDASAYREIPIGVVRPMDVDDLHKTLAFARKHKLGVIPRTAGTSIAGQVVGKGLVVDVSRYMTNILEVNTEEHWVRLQPGVVLDELNKYLEPYGLFFGPETSTSTRCMIGGMVGNNSCGAHSLIYGSTRDHLISLKCILSDGSEAEFGPMSRAEFDEKCAGNQLESKICRDIRDILENTENQNAIRDNYPDPALHRRNTGYALDLLLDMPAFTEKPNNPEFKGEYSSTFDQKDFNFCKLLAGSEGTLAFTTEIKLNLVPLPPKNKILVCVHHDSVQESLKANILALKHGPVSIELIDKELVQCTENSPSQRENRVFIEGRPGAILVVEFFGDSEEDLENKASALIEDFKRNGYGYHYPVLRKSDMNKVWNLRKAGLGLLSNVEGDAKPAPVVEDTAVNAYQLPEYIEEFDKMLQTHGLNCVYYAHISTGELHLRPVLNLKEASGVELFHRVALDTAKLVKKFRGSLSGEHGDGRLRGEFIELMLGEQVFQLLHQVKNSWDPNGLFNPNKIVNTPKMNTSLRYRPGNKTKDFKTFFDFSKEGGYLRSIEKCNGSGDCRKSEIIGGVMCPSYQASRDEDKSTRARANILREYLTYSDVRNPFDQPEIYQVLDLCLSCKGCKSECPSNVDMTKYKAEYLQHYYDANGIPFRTRMIGHFSDMYKFGNLMPGLFNFMASNKFTSGLIKSILGFAPQRTLPKVSNIKLQKFLNAYEQIVTDEKAKVNLFLDEFTQYTDVKIGITTVKLLNALGYRVLFPKHTISGRTFLSKGMLRKARELADRNVELLSSKVSEDCVLIGIEPSAILTFKDEYPELVGEHLVRKSRELASNTFLFDEFFIREVNKGNISKEMFTKAELHTKFHGHCHQKALGSVQYSLQMLSFPENYLTQLIPSGCCGMAGSFGYEKEHFDVSIKAAELKLLPEVRQTPYEIPLVAMGTSCREQIKHGTNRQAVHPVEIMYDALTK